MNFKNRYREKLQIGWKEIFDANVLIQLVTEENSIEMSAEPALTC